MKNLASARQLFIPAAVVVAAVAVSFGVNALAATFTQPTGAPTNYNAPAPLDTSGNANAKVGGLILNTGGATNGLIVQAGNVGIGTQSPIGNLDVENDANTAKICLNGKCIHSETPHFQIKSAILPFGLGVADAPLQYVDCPSDYTAIACSSIIVPSGSNSCVTTPGRTDPNTGANACEQSNCTAGPNPSDYGYYTIATCMTFQ